MRTSILAVAIGLVAFLVSLDGLIVNVAIPTISGELGVRSDVGTWVVTVFSMSSTLFIALASVLAPRFGRIHLFVGATLAFTLFSFLSATAGSFTELLIYRIAQGAAAGTLTPVTLMLIITSFPTEKRGIAVGLWSFFVMVSPAMGPMIGGFFSNYRWHWMFFLNVPIGLICALTVWILLRRQKEEKTRRPLDTVGIFLLFTAMCTLQSALNRGQIDDWFRSSFITALLLISLVCFLFFLIWESTSEHPFIQLATFKKRNFTLAAVMMGGAMGMIFSSFILDSLWVQEVLGYTPFWAGLSLTPVGFFPLLLYPVMGKIVGKLDRRAWLTLSFLLYSITFFLLSRINLQTSFAHLAYVRLVQGIGFAMFTIPLSLMAMEGAVPTELPRIVSLYSFFRTLCVAISIPLATTLWIHRQAFYQSRLAARSFVENPNFQGVLNRLGNLDVSQNQSLNLAYDLVVNQASTLGLADIYYLFGWLFLVLLIPVYLSRSVPVESAVSQ